MFPKLSMSGGNGNSDYNGYLKIQVLCHVNFHDQEPNYKSFSQVYVEDSRKNQYF